MPPVDVAESLRVFLALWPGARARESLAACRDHLGLPSGARAVASRDLHLTLHFIGRVPSARLAETSSALQVGFRGFKLKLDLIEYWRGGVAVLRPRDEPQRLLVLHSELADALQRLGLPVEARAFRPHVTLARRCLPFDARALDEPLSWQVGGYALVESVPGQNYRLLRRFR